MYKKIMWATDGTEEAELALAETRRLARTTSARIVAVHCDRALVGDDGGSPPAADGDSAAAKLRQRTTQLQQMGVDIELVVRRTHEEPADAVAALADELAVDAIVCDGRGGTSLATPLPGSFTHRLIDVAPCPVLVVPDTAVPASRRSERRRVRA